MANTLMFYIKEAHSDHIDEEALMQKCSNQGGKKPQPSRIAVDQQSALRYEMKHSSKS